jgi:hypothetical protein
MHKQITYGPNEEEYERLYHDEIEYFNGQIEESITQRGALSLSDGRMAR